MDAGKFMTLVYPEPNSGCWLWAGSVGISGHGRGHFLKRTMQLAHRYSYWIHRGPFDLKYHVLHHCDNPCCVNPDHLYLGDQRQNNLDRDNRGRQRTKRGSHHKLAKITEADSVEIRKLHLIHKVNQRDVAKMFGISQRKVLDIVKNRSWKHTISAH